MVSIRDYAGAVFLCGDCGQPCFEGEVGLQHFREQWDGVFCPRFPLAGKRIVIEWDAFALETLKAKYVDSYPRFTAAGS